MKPTRTVLFRLGLAGAVLLWLPSTASAYIDAGTGSYVLQLVLAGFLGLLFALKVFWHRTLGFLKSFFRRRRA